MDDKASTATQTDDDMAVYTIFFLIFTLFYNILLGKLINCFQNL